MCRDCLLWFSTFIYYTHAKLTWNLVKCKNVLWWWITQSNEMSVSFDHCFHENHLWISGRSLTFGLLWPLPSPAPISWDSFAVSAFVAVVVHILHRLKQINFCPHINPHFSSLFLTCFQDPVTHCDSSHVPHFQDLAALWSTSKLPCTNYFHLFHHCVFIVCLFLSNLVRCFVSHWPCSCRCLSQVKRSRCVDISRVCSSLFSTSDEFPVTFWSNCLVCITIFDLCGN